jgi:hypothetical protein
MMEPATDNMEPIDDQPAEDKENDVGCCPPVSQHQGRPTVIFLDILYGELQISYSLQDNIPLETLLSYTYKPSFMHVVCTSIKLSVVYFIDVPGDVQ